MLSLHSGSMLLDSALACHLMVTHLRLLLQCLVVVVFHAWRVEQRRGLRNRLEACSLLDVDLEFASKVHCLTILVITRFLDLAVLSLNYWYTICVMIQCISFVTSPLRG